MIKYIVLVCITMIVSASLFAQVRSCVIKEYCIGLYDTVRNRSVPLVVYCPDKKVNMSGVILFNNGYDGNVGGSYRVYSYLTRTLAAAGYFVISIQHELPEDEFLAMEGDLYVNRMSNWVRGVENILFAMNEVKKECPDLNWLNVIVIGHSNGGDMAMLFAEKYPKLISKVISLDHRRVPIPRVYEPKIYSLRGCDYGADTGVIPDVEELRKYSIKIVKLDGVKHSDMDDKGSRSQHDSICKNILGFLRE